MSSFTVGNNIQTVNATVKGARYFYGLRRTDDGDLYLIKADALKNGLFTMIGPKKKFQIVNSGDCIGVGFNVFV